MHIAGSLPFHEWRLLRGLESDYAVRHYLTEIIRRELDALFSSSRHTSSSSIVTLQLTVHSLFRCNDDGGNYPISLAMPPHCIIMALKACNQVHAMSTFTIWQSVLRASTGYPALSVAIHLRLESSSDPIAFTCYRLSQAYHISSSGRYDLCVMQGVGDFLQHKLQIWLFQVH